MNAGDANAALALTPLAAAGADSAKIAQQYIALHVRALATLGRVDEAQRLAADFDRWLAPAMRSAITRNVAWGWGRRGALDHARQALAAGRPEADSSETAGWLAPYQGDLLTTRQ